MALQPFLGPWSLFQFPNPIRHRQDSLDGGQIYIYEYTVKYNLTNANKPCVKDSPTSSSRILKEAQVNINWDSVNCDVFS
jgi:hypothetical protein